MFAGSNSRRRRSRNLKAARRNKRTRMHQLDVRMRSRKETRMKIVEFAKLALRTSCIAAAIAATVLSSRWIFRKAFYENREFALTELEIETNGELSHQRIVNEGDIRDGVNLLRIDIEQVRARLKQLPQVREVEVSRHLPNRLAVKVTERFPVAWIACPAMGIRARTSDRGFMLDADGVVIPCESLLRKYLNLPVIRARTLPQVKPGARLESEQILAALRLIARSNEALFEEQVEVLEVDMRNDYSMRAYYNNDAEVTFGMEDIEDQLSDLKLILAHAGAKNRQVATLNLMPRKNIPITYFNFPGDGLESDLRNPGPGGAAPAGGAEPASGRPEAEQRLNAIRAILGRG